MATMLSAGDGRSIVPTLLRSAATGGLFWVRKHSERCRGNSMPGSMRQWYYMDEAGRQGPIPEAELRRLAQAGSIYETTMVWTEQLPDWRVASSIKGLVPVRAAASVAAPTAPPPPPMAPLAPPTMAPSALPGLAAPVARPPFSGLPPHIAINGWLALLGCWIVASGLGFVVQEITRSIRGTDTDSQVAAFLFATAAQFLLLVLPTAIWAAIDASRIGLAKYKTNVAKGPVTLAICVAFIWIVAFPWYIHVRSNVMKGTQPLR